MNSMNNNVVTGNVVVNVDAMDMRLIHLLEMVVRDLKVQDPLYVKNDDIRAELLDITGEVIGKAHNRAFLVNAIKSSMAIDYDAIMAHNPNTVFTPFVIDVEEVKKAELERRFGKSYLEKTESSIDKLPELARQQIGKEIGFDTIGIIPENKPEIKSDTNLPLYIKEENCDIESKELDKRLLMAQVINAASSNIVKAFITRGMLLSVINKELFGIGSLYKNPIMKVNGLGEFTPTEVALATKTLNELVTDYLIPHKMGFKVKPYYMAWFHKNANLTYQVKGREYLINTSRKVIINLVTKNAVPLNKVNCEYLNDGLFVRVAR